MLPAIPRMDAEPYSGLPPDYVPPCFHPQDAEALSSLWKVTRSMTPEISSVAGRRCGFAAFICGSHFPTHAKEFGEVRASGSASRQAQGCF